mmetsp:Transcript_57186/g.77991  ORF Transcript_57186/g.77991 Transcript_57186/m.77991 type:complete len:200 (-) Transcript_57186:611-1210(-)
MLLGFHFDEYNLAFCLVTNIRFLLNHPLSGVSGNPNLNEDCLISTQHGHIAKISRKSVYCSALTLKDPYMPRELWCFRFSPQVRNVEICSFSILVVLVKSEEYASEIGSIKKQATSVSRHIATQSSQLAIFEAYPENVLQSNLQLCWAEFSRERVQLNLIVVMFSVPPLRCFLKLILVGCSVLIPERQVKQRLLPIPLF